MDSNAIKALKQIKMEIAAEYEIHPEHIFSLVELGYDKLNTKPRLRVKRSKERRSFSKTGHLE